MTDLLAIVSKAQFEALSKTARPGDRLGLDRYTSTHKALAPLAGGGALFLVTVRPPDEKLWLVAILESPRQEDGAWRAAPSEVPIADVTAVRDQLQFSTGTGIQAKKGALGMSLQTPRQLTEKDAALLRSAAGAMPACAAGPVPAPEPKIESPAKAARAKDAKAAKASGKAPPTPAAPLPPTGPYVPEEPRPFTGEAAQLWQRILADPDDLKTRSVLADLLQEQGDPLGEFLQLSCLLEELSEDDPRRPTLAERVETLRCQHVVPWTREVASIRALRPRQQPYRRAFSIRRGLVESLACTTRALPGLAAAAKVAPIRRLEVDPFGESVRVTGWANALAAMPELARIRDLDLKVESDAEALAVLRSPHLVRLERLVVAGVPDSHALLSEIVQNKACAQLQDLQVSASSAPKQPPPFDRLAALPLRTLSLGRAGVGPAEAQAIAGMKTLQSLTLHDEALGLTGARALAAAAGLSGLRGARLRAARSRRRAWPRSRRRRRSPRSRRWCWAR
ncbi:MAG: TIGR02996 domain-containing protein [Myxococcales bacterium]